MKKIYILLTLIFGVCLISCGSKPVAEKEEATAPVVEKEAAQPEANEPAPIDDDDVELINEEVSMIDEDEEEYLRSTKDLSAEEVVTKDEFTEDKAEILRIIKNFKK